MVVMNASAITGAMLAAALCVIGCSSSDDRSQETEDVDTSEIESKVETKDLVCSTTYSDVVAVHVSYASVHCDGWTGKVFCEYDSLSYLYGPGWGQCQCYNTTCYEDGRKEDEAGRRCYGWWCGGR